MRISRPSTPATPSNTVNKNAAAAAKNTVEFQNMIDAVSSNIKNLESNEQRQSFLLLARDMHDTALPKEQVAKRFVQLILAHNFKNAFSEQKRSEVENAVSGVISSDSHFMNQLCEQLGRLQSA